MPETTRTIIPRQSGRTFPVAKGDLVRIIDVAGQQVADLWAFVTEPELDWLSTSQTREFSERLFPAIGGVFCSDRGKKLLYLCRRRFGRGT
ncbi:MAG: DUF1989 domain-containing protein [Alphaproteobacteria bacterium]|jgi:uncharacterized protein|nr:DUF1989 domain-containing protein [Alphaproteobacteria bacterium]